MSATEKNSSNSPKVSILKHVREQKGLTLEIVHEATKIPMDALRAIEEGYSVRILSPFYYRGFIKIYAEFLGTDVEEAWQEYGLDPVTKGGAIVKPVVVKPVQPNPIAENMQEMLASLMQSKVRKMIGRGLALVVGVIILVKVGGCVVAKIKAAPKPKVHTSEAKQKKPIVKDVKKNEEAIVPLATSLKPIKAAGTAVASLGRKVKLAVRAPKDSWIQVKADDKIVFQMTMKKGTMETWSADKHIELSGKNINELEMEVNGKHIGALGNSQRRAKRVLITKEGLTVKK